MTHLLFISISDKNVSSIIKTLESNEIDIDYLVLDSHEEINQEIIDHSYWDAIILSEHPSKNYPQLTSVVEKFSDIPIIFFTEDYSNQLFTEVMNHGANDCISVSDTPKLPPILRRELSKPRVKKNNQNLAESSDLLSDIVDLSTDNIFLFHSQNLHYCYANRTAIKHLAYSRSELDKMTAPDIYSEYDFDSFSDLIHPLLQNKRSTINICTNVIRKMGVVHPAEVQLKKITHENRSYILAINKDISDSWYKVRKLNRQRSLTNSYINKHKQKEELLANAAHDMRTSLQSIILSNKLLFDKQSGEFQQGFDKFQKAIHFSGKHLLNYINEFFDQSNDKEEINSPTLTSTSLNLRSFTKKLFLVFKPIAQRNEIDFHFESSKLNHTYIATNQTYVKRVLKNLLSNAFKFTNEGSVTFEVYSLASHEIANTKIKTDDAVAFKIKDTGIGIPKTQQKTIFGRHKRTENTKKGSGLGLHICQKLSKSLGGEIEVKSEIKKGTTFTLYLPAKESKSISHKKNGHVTQKKAIQNQNKTILIIDDSEVHNLAIKEYLKYTFDECIAVNTLSKAYEELSKTEIDCIVSDYTIKNNTCMSFLEEISNNTHYSDIPKIVYTGKKLCKTDRDTILNFANTIIKKKAGSYDTLTNTIISFFRKHNYNNSSLVE